EKAEQVIHSSNNKVLTLPSLDKPFVKKKPDVDSEQQISRLARSKSAKETTAYKGLLEPILVAKEGNKPAPNAPAPGQQAKNLRNLQVISNPSNQSARKLLSERYGVALPNVANKREHPKEVPGKVVTGSTSDHLSTLPKANRVDPSTTPPPISEDDAQKGILSLIERGLIPPAAVLTLQPSPVRHVQAPLHELSTQTNKNRAPPPPDVVGVGGYNLAIVKGWTDGYRRKPLPLKCIEGPDQISGPIPTPLGEIKGIHKFVIQNGKTRVTSQDYLDFKQHYCLSWGSILTLIIDLEELMTNYSVPIAFIDGDRLADLALVFELEQQPSLEHFLTCILNGDDVEKIIKTPGRRYIGPRGSEMAAIKIQSTWRRYKDRAAYLLYRKQKWAAGVIAISWIMNCKLSMIRKQLKETRRNQLERFKLRNKKFQEDWGRIKKSRRVVIHIASLVVGLVTQFQYGFAQHIRDELSDINLLQNLQMGRLCDIADPKVEVIYICPVEINEEVYQYYTKLLAMKARPLSSTYKSSDDEDDIENRYKIIVPDAVHSFPTHNMCLSSILMYSPRTIKRIKNLIKGRDAYIVPGILHKNDIYVADLLDIPIFSPEPEVAQLYSTKSGSKRIFLSAKVDIPPGQFDVYSLPQDITTAFITTTTTVMVLLSVMTLVAVVMVMMMMMMVMVVMMVVVMMVVLMMLMVVFLAMMRMMVVVLMMMMVAMMRMMAVVLMVMVVLLMLHESLAQLVTENLHVKRWLFKMDNEFDGRGTAYCDVTPYLKCYQWALKECNRYGEKWSKKWAHEPTLIKVSAEIAEILISHAQPVKKVLYPSWDLFLQDFLKRGGVIEACPPSESVTALTVNILVEPDGDTKILSMGDQIHAASPFMCWGYSVPQASVDPVQLSTAAQDIAMACKLRGVIGHFTVDFVTFIDPITMEQALWAVDLKLQYSDIMAMTNLMLYVSGGNIDGTRSTFEVPVKRKRAESGRRRRRRVHEEEELPPNPNRYAILSTQMTHTNLSVIHYSVFFQMCRAHGIGYDMKERAGTIFTLVDSSKRDHLGMLYAAIDDIDNILGTTQENTRNPPPARSPQLQAPRPKEMQKILQEHQQAMHPVEKDKQDMQDHKEQQRQLDEERMRTAEMERSKTKQSFAPPPSPAHFSTPAESVAETRDYSPFSDEQPE
ncbi:hypothetical protein QZH41_012675, partial [Actinostola sp. cb2023]